MNYSQDNNRKRMKRHKSHGKRVKNKVGFVFLRVFVAVFLISIFAVSAAGIGAYFSIIQGAPSLDDLSFDLFEGSFDSVVLDAMGNEIARLDGGVNREFAEWEEIPEHLWQAFVAIEDERFFEHNGIDARGMVRAVYQTLLHSNTQGASTITQQLIKNLLGVTRNTIESKLQEQYLAIQFETMLVEYLGSMEAAKERILHLYLNIAYLGHGNHGVQAAARFYFNKDVSELTISESAVIAAITQWPWQHSPIRFPDWNRSRQIDVLDSMLRLEYITEAQHRYAVNDDPFARIQTVVQEVHADAVIWPYFVDAVIDQLMADFMAQGRIRSEASHLIYNGGLRIYTTMDPRIQSIVDDTFLNEEHFPTNPQDFEYHLRFVSTTRNEDTGLLTNHDLTSVNWGRRVTNRDMFPEFLEWARGQTIGMSDYEVAHLFFYTPQPQSSMVVLDHNNGHVVAIAGQRGEKQSNRAFNRATRATRQPGSVFKMFASFAPAFDMGLITAATTYDDAPNVIFEPGRGYRVWPQNWYSNSAFPYRGFHSVRHAIEHSYNVIAVRNAEATGMRNIFNYLRNFGFNHLLDSEADNLSLALGGTHVGVTNLEITAAQGAIANGGIMHQPILYTRVVDRHGNVLIDNENSEPWQVLNRYSAYLLIDTMRGAVTRGSATAARFQNIQMDSMGKTGTTQYTRDIYYTGSTPHFTASVWVGHDQPRTLTSAVTGSNRIDTRIWRYVMERVHVELELERLTFEQPPGFVTAQVCGVSGRLPIPGLCNHDPRGSQIRTEIFAPGTVPTTFCDVHMQFEFNHITGMLPCEWCPAEQIVTRIGIVRDRSWMEVAGNVPIRDAAFEVPQAVLRGEVCNVHDAFTQHGPHDPDYPYGSDYYGDPDANNSTDGEPVGGQGQDQYPPEPELVPIPTPTPTPGTNSDPPIIDDYEGDD